MKIIFTTVGRQKLGDVSDINAASGSFSFLADEPDLYSREDLRKQYV